MGKGYLIDTNSVIDYLDDKLPEKANKLFDNISSKIYEFRMYLKKINFKWLAKHINHIAEHIVFDKINGSLLKKNSLLFCPALQGRGN